MQTNLLINEILTRMGTVLSADSLAILERELSLALENYSITEKCTQLAVPDKLPIAYSAFLVAKKIEGRSDGTLTQYRLYIEDMLYAIAKPLEAITTNDLRAYLYQVKVRRHISDRTLDGRRVVIGGFFQWATDEGYLSHNPAKAIHRIKYEKKERTPFTDIELERLRNACKSVRDMAIVETLYSSGCRVGELVYLKRDDVDLERRTVKLYGKGKKHRTACLSAKAAITLNWYLLSREDDCPYLFVSMRRPAHGLTVSGMEDIVERIGKRAGVAKVFPHRFRHTFTTHAIEHGMNVVYVQSLLGYESLDTTASYVKVNQESIQAAHRKYIV